MDKLTSTSTGEFFPGFLKHQQYFGKFQGECPNFFNGFEIQIYHFFRWPKRQTTLWVVGGASDAGRPGIFDVFSVPKWRAVQNLRTAKSQGRQIQWKMTSPTKQSNKATCSQGLLRKSSRFMSLKLTQSFLMGSFSVFFFHCISGFCQNLDKIPVMLFSWESNFLSFKSQNPLESWR